MVLHKTARIIGTLRIRAVNSFPVAGGMGMLNEIFTFGASLFRQQGRMQALLSKGKSRHKIKTEAVFR